MNPLKLIRTSTFQLAWWYMGIFGGSALIMVGFVYWATVGQLERQIDANIRADIAGLVDQYREYGASDLARLVRLRLEQRGGEPMLYLLGIPGDRPMAGNLRDWPQGRITVDGWLEFSFRDERGRPAPARGYVLPLEGGLYLLVGRALTDLQASRNLINKAYIWSLLLGLGLAALGGTLMSLSVTRRIDAINRTSREIMTGRLKHRMPVRGVNDEFDQLADNLNAMLDRMDTLIDGVRSVADNIAHDLRTPLTRLRGRLESLSSRTDVGEDIRHELAACQHEADHLLATFRALLRIARIESGSHDRVWSEVDLGTLLTDAWEMYDALGEEKGVKLRYTPTTARVHGDRDLIFQAVSNLLDNAVKYSPAGAGVELVVEDRPDHVDIVVDDHGRGIPADEMDKVLGRFYRASTATDVSGSGLGLSLVNAIAAHHDGQILLGDNAPGLSVRLRLPKNASGTAVAAGRDS